MALSPPRMTLLALSLCVWIGSRVDAAEVYRYKAPDGSTVFTDQKPSVPAEKVVVEPAPARTPTERNDATNRSRSVEGIARDRLQRDAEAAAAARAEAARKQREDAERCQRAREQNAYFQMDGVYAEPDVNGKPVFMAPEEVKRRRAAAKRDMAEFCR